MQGSRFPQAPVWLLTFLVLLPVLVLAGAGLRLLRMEQQQLVEKAENVQVKLLEWKASRIRQQLEAVQSELLTEISGLPAADKDRALMELQRSHPLVRNVFRMSEEGQRVLPKSGIYLDRETALFVQRYEMLFTGRHPWFPPQAEVATKGLVKKGPTVRTEWRSWRWGDREQLLVYLSYGDSPEVVGLEVEMAALYARMNTWLQELASDDGVLLLLDRMDRVLVASGDPEDLPLRRRVELGPLLPYAQLAMASVGVEADGATRASVMLAGSVGVLMVLSILGGTLGLTLWVNRSRREALRKTSFVSNVSHEFKTPLTTLRLYSELLLEGRVQDPEKQRKYLCTLRDESERLARLVHNALDFSRLEMGRSRLHPEELNLKRVLENVFERMQERFEAAGMQVELPQEDLPGIADKDAAEQIVLNLFDNAVKYAASGGQLRVTGFCSAKGLELRFADAGPGIPARERGRIFKAFHQLDDRLNRESGGTGLGLHISRRLARSMGGDLNCACTDQGCCFVWTLPAAEKEEAL